MVDLNGHNETQDMIEGWTTPTSKGEHLVKEFKLKGGQRCKFICVVND